MRLIGVPIESHQDVAGAGAEPRFCAITIDDCTFNAMRELYRASPPSTDRDALVDANVA